ncbi:sugar phosphate isomerase/epimerase family protein [Bergeriella denitrificans]|uniref:Xylose isomerase-like TIM barrel n=1 Tax=Bergeriella denitrificans TaxID=494 RepID=A0A378UHP9_BERDE|nr:TIM barrel protein [Bergeriella denitrificans]STZ76002.1 Xylose isomerase-like TIM barrel [Bergeriella denitrificans]
MTRQIGIAPLSVLGTEPVEFIRAAAAAGYDFVGLRTRPVTATEKDLNLLPGSTRLKEVSAVLQDTGMKVADTEFIGMDEHCNRDFWLPMLESAAELGAKSLTFTITDPDLSRATATTAKLAEDARQFNLTVTLEPISYQTVKLLPEAVEIAKQTGCKILFDTLHFHRAFGETAHITAAKPYLADMVQLCDGILADRADTREGLIEESRSLRYVPGEGDFKLAECVALLPETMPVSIEVPNPKFAELGLQGWLAYLKQATEQVLARADALRG